MLLSLLPVAGLLIGGWTKAIAPTSKDGVIAHNRPLYLATKIDELFKLCAPPNLSLPFAAKEVLCS